MFALPRSTFRFEKLMVTQLFKKSPAFYNFHGPQNFIIFTRVHQLASVPEPD